MITTILRDFARQKWRQHIFGNNRVLDPQLSSITVTVLTYLINCKLTYP